MPPFAYAVGGGLDCNGYSHISKNVIKNVYCADPQGINHTRFYDNNWYVGHDEPSMKFVSDSKGSANNTEWQLTLPGDGTSVSMSQLYPTFWLSMALCDPNSTPFGPCIPDSDSNNPYTTGSALLELQFYPDCNLTQWCAALTIDSLELNQTGYANPNCAEPVNFAYIQTDGIPTGPPGPGSQTGSPITANTLLMNPGDHVTILIQDDNNSTNPTQNGLFVKITDQTTGESGFMIASATNGFEDTVSNFATNACTPTPFSFHPEYGTANDTNITPWSALQANVNIAFEIGHAEIPDNDLDDPCAICGVKDFDFDGTSYQADWPNGNDANPSSVVIGSIGGNGAGPESYSSTHASFSKGYNKIEFATEVGDSDLNCSSSGSGCEIPPQGAVFYPFYTQAGSGTGCTFDFGNDISGVTTNDFGRDAQYGAPGFTAFGGLMANPCVPSTPATPSPPRDVSATVVSSSSIKVSWDFSNGAASYLIYRSTSSSGPFTTQTGISTSTSFTDTGLSPGTPYYYKVSATNSAGTSSLSTLTASAITLSDMQCSPPALGNWTISSGCSLSSTSTAPANVVVQSGAVLTIPNGLNLIIDFTHHHLLVKSGSGVLIRAGGAIN